MTLFLSPVTWQMLVVNWLMKRRWRSALRDQVDVVWDWGMELVRGLWSVKMMKFLALNGVLKLL